MHEDLKLSVSHKSLSGVADFNVPHCHLLMSLPSEYQEVPVCLHFPPSSGDKSLFLPCTYWLGPHHGPGPRETFSLALVVSYGESALGTLLGRLAMDWVRALTPHSISSPSSVLELPLI